MKLAASRISLTWLVPSVRMNDEASIERSQPSRKIPLFFVTLSHIEMREAAAKVTAVPNTPRVPLMLGI